MIRWNSSVDDLKSTLGCSFASGGLTLAFISAIEVGEAESGNARTSILDVCKQYRNKLAKRMSQTNVAHSEKVMEVHHIKPDNSLTTHCNYDGSSCVHKSSFKQREYPCDVCTTAFAGVKPSRWYSSRLVKARKSALTRELARIHDEELRADRACHAMSSSVKGLVS